MLVPLDQIAESEKRFHSFKKSPLKHASVVHEKTVVDKAAASASNNGVHDAEEAQKLARRKEMLQTIRREPVDFAFERAIGKNDSVYSNFCELISDAKQKVCRIVIKSGNKKIGFATGFMVSERLMLTNWHVFQTAADVADSEIEFNYEYDMYGRENSPVIFKLSSSDFFCSDKELDYCLVAVSPTDISGKVLLSAFGYLYLNPITGKVGEEGTELLNIIHHPDGDYKQLSIRENRFTKALDNTIWYETDTAPGSSGSPVFNDQWQVVALHHMGIPSKSGDGKNYLDINGKIIGSVDGKVDISKICWIANEGIRVSVLIKDVIAKNAGSTFIEGMKNSSNEKPAKKGTTTDIESPATEAKPQLQPNLESDYKGDVRVSFPASLLEKNGLSIAFDTGQSAQDKMPGISAPVDASAMPDEFLAEMARIDMENGIDYTNCNGYLSGFLGVNIPIPKPLATLKKFVAKHKTSDSYIFKYYHFSVIFHSTRRMPAISAINIDGDSKKRLDDTKRVDVWLRDNRMDYEIQLNDKYYELSGFDKGHMSRREDADWALTAELAKQYADLTCVYTNACPQVPKLNRSTSSGLWGKLEKVILEKGAEAETGKPAKISVFNGPVFTDNDPVFRGVQVPLKFWKVVLWFNAAGQLRATAFTLSQDTLVDDITFEELNFDSNADFQQYQCGIASLQQLTHLDFSALLKYDTFNVANNPSPLKINSEEELKDFVHTAFHT